MYKIETAVRMGHVDPAGTIYFARVPEVAYDAFEAYLDEMGWSLGKHIMKMDVLTPVVNCQTNYKIPIRLSDRLTIEVEAKRIGDTSFTLFFNLKGESGATHATCEITQVCVDRENFKPTALPELMRDGLEKLNTLPS